MPGSKDDVGRWGGESMRDESKPDGQRVVIAGFDVDILQMAGAMIKMAVAALPAIVLLLLAISAINYYIGGFF